MKYYLVLLLLASINVFTQPIAVTVDRIIASDSTYNRSFQVSFTIENTSNKPISFFLDPQNFIPAQGGPLASAVFYKIYQEQEVIEVSGILGQRLSHFGGAAQARYINYKMVSPADLELLKIKQQNDYFTTLMTLTPGEKRSYSTELMWNYERFQKQGDNEYQIDANKPHYFELLLIFWREEYESKLSAEQFQSVLNMDSLIKGWFVSNKVEIDFSEKSAKPQIRN